MYLVFFLQEEDTVRNPDGSRKGYTCGDRSDACFKVVTEAKNWNEARKDCRNDFAMLATVNSEEEAKVNLENFFKKTFIHLILVLLQDLMEMLQAVKDKVKGSADPTVAWVGVHSAFEPGEWLNIVNDPLKRNNLKWAYSKIKMSRPSDKYTRCAVFYEKGGFVMSNCDDKYAYVCKQRS